MASIKNPKMKLLVSKKISNEKAPFHSINSKTSNNVFSFASNSFFFEKPIHVHTIGLYMYYDILVLKKPFISSSLINFCCCLFRKVWS